MMKTATSLLARLMMTRTKRKLLAVVTLVATATSAHATVQVDSSMKYYDVVGTTSPAIVASLNNLGPLVDGGKRMWAKTHWKVNVNYYNQPNNDGCRFNSVTTTLNTEITMPQLVTKVPTQTRKWFDEKMKTLLDHEHGHRDIALSIAENIDAAFVNMRAATCKELIDNSREVFDELTKKGNESQANYDAVTKYGLKQQAWPTTVNKKPVEARPSKDQSLEKLQPAAQPVKNIQPANPQPLNNLLFGR
jgi:predicted secreted Zn-dependent protease